MAITLKVNVDSKKLMRDLSALSEKEIPRAAANALNRLAIGSRLKVRDRMEEIFDRPKPFTLNSFWIDTATPNKLEAAVMTKDMAPKGTPAVRYLGPEIHGGRRDMKKFERDFAALSQGQYAVPGKDAPLDRYGNIPRGILIQILSRFNLMSGTSAYMNMSERTAARLQKRKRNAAGQRSDYFIARERGRGLPTGIYKLVGPGKVAQIIRFTPRAPNYKAVLPVEQIVNSTVSRRQDRIVQEEIIKAFRKRGLK
ncbi:hypothetical protein AA0472_2178 [Acetobacter estunensis NRIC 0472]|uniref:Uncharacterized protein n=1 Tax=Acetobacter estunensis TaxID=104097 RepID=A0A967ECG5_9PROT|nr:hypothetical protein [Acetobacter estunensis]NHO54593.1 hypothetical protein [Acetobacter estunensis]GBQ26669.1 hypothetical protein AA0472_2178 [Acetobacter estunensis NRIC 0472]